MKKKLIFSLAIAALLAGTTITFAYSNATATVSISAGGSSGEVSTIQTVGGSGGSAVPDTIKLEYSTGSGPYTHTSPSWSPVNDQAGSITAGDIYYLDCSGYTGDVLVNVYLTNAGALSKDYNYLNMQLNVWSGTSPTWSQATLANSDAIGMVYLTLQNGYYSFILNGATHYDISMDGGSYYCIDANATGGSLSPEFYIEVKPL